MTASNNHGSAARELIAPNGDKRLIRRDDKGRITGSDDLGKSLSEDVKKAAKTTVKPGSYPPCSWK